ncbi:MAG TPA: glycerophosphodiester phosphodiesterase [Candidatus Onthocola stercorigallinarum]|nr:glycerophosphodiester phosphodiesterase [Candidatus Onthocola stercorigallinarum]
MKKFIAHRGIWNDSVKDNSYQALYNGLLSEEYIGIETDVRVTKDNVFVIYHDPLYNGKLVKNVYYKDMVDVCRLEDILKIKTDKIILLEIKDFNMDVKKFIKIIDKYKRNVMIMSFSTLVINKIKTLNTKYKLGVLNYIINSDSNYDYDFICLLDIISNNFVIERLKKRNIEVLIYGVIDILEDATYIIDDNKLKGLAKL